MTEAPDIAVDTSVAIALLVGSHPDHAMTMAWAHGRVLHLSGHAVAETYSVLTRLPGDARSAASDAAEQIDRSFSSPFLLSGRGSSGVHRELARRGISGGAVYDGLVALAAREHSAVLATRDARARSTYEAVGVTVELVPGRAISSPLPRG